MKIIIQIVSIFIFFCFLFSGCAYRHLERDNIKFTDFSIWYKQEVDDLNVVLDGKKLTIKLKNHKYDPEKIDEIVNVLMKNGISIKLDKESFND